MNLDVALYIVDREQKLRIRNKLWQSDLAKHAKQAQRFQSQRKQNLDHISPQHRSLDMVKETEKGLEFSREDLLDDPARLQMFYDIFGKQYIIDWILKKESKYFPSNKKPSDDISKITTQ